MYTKFHGQVKEHWIKIKRMYTTQYAIHIRRYKQLDH